MWPRISRIVWAYAMLLHAKSSLRNAVEQAKDYAMQLRVYKANLDYFLHEQPKRRMEVIMAQIELDIALGRKPTCRSDSGTTRK